MRYIVEHRPVEKRNFTTTINLNVCTFYRLFPMPHNIFLSNATQSQVVSPVSLNDVYGQYTFAIIEYALKMQLSTTTSLMIYLSSVSILQINLLGISCLFSIYRVFNSKTVCNKKEFHFFLYGKSHYFLGYLILLVYHCIKMDFNLMFFFRHRFTMESNTPLRINKICSVVIHLMCFFFAVWLLRDEFHFTYVDSIWLELFVLV